MNVTTIIAAVSLLIALLGLTVTGATLRRKTDDTYTAHLEGQLRSVEAENIRLTEVQRVQGQELDQCKRGREELQGQNFKLMSELFDLHKKMERNGFDA